MLSKSLVLGAVLCWGSVANAGGISFLELVPTRPGPFVGGEAMEIDVIFNNREGQDIELRLAQLDFAASDVTLDIADFSIDVSGVLIDALYIPFPTDFASGRTVANVTYVGSTSLRGLLLSVPDGGALSLGAVSVILPDAPGGYVLDVLNQGAPTTDTGARFDYGFDHRVTLSASDGSLAGDSISFEIMPEPATLALLGVGGVWMVRRRRLAAR